MSIQIDKITNQFIRELKITKKLTKKPLIVVMVGLTGSGKTLVAETLAPLINATVVAGDAVRLMLRKKGQDYASVRNITNQAAVYLLEHGSSVIIDSDFVGLPKRKRFEKDIKKTGAKIVYVRVAANRDVMIGRLINAKYNPNRDLFKNNTVAIREMWRRTPHHYDWNSTKGGQFLLKKLSIPFLAEIDTSDEHKKQVKKLAGRINKIN